MKKWLTKVLGLNTRNITTSQRMRNSAAAREIRSAALDRAIAHAERLVFQEGRSELAYELANSYMNKANAAIIDSGDVWTAVKMCDQAIPILDRLVFQEGREELTDELANDIIIKANALTDCGDAQTAVTLYDQAIALREQLVKTGSHHELASELARTYMNKVRALYKLGDKRAAVALCDRASEIWEQILHQEDHGDLDADLAYSDAYRKMILLTLHEVGADEAFAAWELFGTEVTRSGRADLKRAYNQYIFFRPSLPSSGMVEVIRKP